MEVIEIDNVPVPHRIIPTKGDGSCFYYALSYLMYGTDLQAQQLRESVVQHVCNNWERFQNFTVMPSGNIYTNPVEYRANMSLGTTYTTPCEIAAAEEIFPYHLVVYRDGRTIIQPDVYVEGRPILRFRCTGQSLMSSHFEPLTPLDDTSHKQQPYVDNYNNIGKLCLYPASR